MERSKVINYSSEGTQGLLLGTTLGQKVSFCVVATTE